MAPERDLLSHVSETREALRKCREARKEFEVDMSNVLLQAKWKLAEHAYFEAKRSLDAAVNAAIGIWDVEA
jgi:hypothetical protein